MPEVLILTMGYYAASLTTARHERGLMAAGSASGQTSIPRQRDQ
jgi:hypothetical protein